jgi:glycosyltransferase involved in cell wall biosynthesis
MSNQPKISIIIPSYNQGTYLRQTLLSIINQDYTNYEILVVDGGSTDNTLDVIEEFSDHIHYWVSEKDRGQAHALNKGYAIATGEIIGWQNSDDLYEPGAFLAAAQGFSKNSSADFIFGNYRLIDKDAKIVKSYYAINFEINTKLYENTIVYNQALFWKKSFSDKMIVGHAPGPFDESIYFVMDAEFVFRAYLEGAIFVRINKFLGSFRMHLENKTSTLNDVFVSEYDAIRFKNFSNYSKKKEKFFKIYLKPRRHALSLVHKLMHIISSNFYLRP